ncbi:hypothetical protein MMAR_4018 [Mycobacterium marinum M]|uniref:Uncharacterized protein n=1 Tax=Mycobacterium marinum (strain ATCC BAA-535 / M) TaxID=216594 RepID=B2HQD3_MYCMM|nr:hypothetical protein MMAR_4018 [Mycobacterium marinum M]
MLSRAEAFVTDALPRRPHIAVVPAPTTGDEAQPRSVIFPFHRCATRNSALSSPRNTAGRRLIGGGAALLGDSTFTGDHALVAYNETAGPPYQRPDRAVLEPTVPVPRGR